MPFLNKKKKRERERRYACYTSTINAKFNLV